MKKEKQEPKVEIIAVPDLALVPKDIADIIISALELEISEILDNQP